MTLTTDRPAAPPTRHTAPGPDRDTRLVRLLAAALAVLVVGFGGFYWWDQRTPTSPSMNAQAIATAEAGVRKTPNSVEARLALASAYEMDQRYDDAIAQVDEILKVSKDNRAAYLARGYAHYLKKDLDPAAADYRKVIDLGVKGEFSGADALLQEAHYYLGTILERQGKHQSALDELNLALKIDKTDSDALYQVGLALTGLGRTKEAVEVFNRALLFVPTGWPEPYAALATAYDTLGQKDEAALARALTSFAKNDFGGANAQLQALLTTSVKGKALVALGTVAQTEGRRDDAKSWFTKALALDPKDAAAQAGLASLAGTTSTSSTGQEVS